MVAAFVVVVAVIGVIVVAEIVNGSVVLDKHCTCCCKS